MCLLTERTSMGNPLLAAIRQQDTNTAKTLLTNGQLTGLEEQGIEKDGTALFIACCKGMAEIVHLLILQGASLESVTSYGARPLHAAVDHNQLEVTRLLLQYGAEVNVLTKRGDTPCHYAAYRGYVELVQALVEAGADVTVVNNKSQSPVHLATSRDHVTIAKYLQAVSDLVKDRPKSSSSLHSLYQRCPSSAWSGETDSLHSGNQRCPSSAWSGETDSLHSGNGSRSSLDSFKSDSPSGRFTCVCRHEPSLTSCRTDTCLLMNTSSMTSLHNICGGNLTQSLKNKQYDKKINWDNV